MTALDAVAGSRSTDGVRVRAGATAGAGERRARMALSCLVEAGDPAVAAEVDRLGAEEVWDQLRRGLLGAGLAERAGLLDLGAFERQLDRGRFRFVVPGEPEWPAGLDDLAHCGTVQRRGGRPFGLWLRGPQRLEQLTRRAVGVVGSRASTGYGDTVASELGLELAGRGVAVVSGGAYGIDAAAHRGALAAGGPTVAVLACGVDVAYPPGNAALLSAIARDHLVASELPPGSHPTRVRFLARNRLIAALTQGSVVVEAAVRSGARNTATWAGACGRLLMAVPGPVHSAVSVVPHRLIRDQQAALVASAGEVLELIAPIGEDLLTESAAGVGRPTDGLDPDTLSVYEVLTLNRRRTAGEVALATGLSVPQCLAELDTLEDAGLARGDDRGWRTGR